MERLPEIGLGIAAVGFAFRIGCRGEDHQRDVAQSLAQLAGEGRPVDAGHVHIKNDHRRRLFVERTERLSTVVRLAHNEAVLGQHLALGRQDVPVVIDEQDRAGAPTDEGHATSRASGVPADTGAVARPKGLRSAEEVVPKLGIPTGLSAVRIGDVAVYDRPIEHLAGQLDRAELDLPLRYRAARFGLCLCFALEPIDANDLALELVRVTNEQGAIWIVGWKKPLLRPGLLSWDAIQTAMLPTGWVDNKILSFGDEVYGTRYVLRKALRN